MPSSGLANYDIGEVIGAGTVGTIYAAIHRETGEKVAIKKLHAGVSQDPLIRARFKRETVVMERLRHPNIIRSMGGGEENGQLFYVMELLDGGTVKDLLQTKRVLHWPVVVEIARQICSALQFAHNHGVIHRDLKPSNLFLTREAEVKLGDFGIARDLQGSDITSSGMTVGTHAYMAPEQITGDANVSGKADLYSLGCCLFEMLVGRTPFQGDHFAQLFEQHLRKPAPTIIDLVPTCPPELSEVISKLLAKSPEDRPFNARQVQASMLQLDESIECLEEGKPQEDDVSAADTTLRGNKLLQQEIERQFGIHSREIGWKKIAIILVVLATLIVLAITLLR
ncbi:MAG: serine/threonine-protein kinase [Planctomycetota bacterium]|nr:serine/threonine-protein kinase [Planctomycetota bacterium]